MASKATMNTTETPNTTTTNHHIKDAKRLSIMTDETDPTVYSEQDLSSHGDRADHDDHPLSVNIEHDGDDDDDTLASIEGLDDLELEMREFEKTLKGQKVYKRRKARRRRASESNTYVSPALRALASMSNGGVGSGKARTFSAPSIQVSPSLKEAEAIVEQRLKAVAAQDNAYFQAPTSSGNGSVSSKSHKGPPKRPDEYLKEVVLQGIPTETLSNATAFRQGQLQGVTEERLAAHQLVVQNTIRAGNVQGLQELMDDGIPLDGCNPQGESFIHLACRLSNVDIVRFLLTKANVSIRVQDDAGRTPLHDAAWTCHPNFELILLLLEECPELLLILDKRSFSALRYIPQSVWKEWCRFLDEHQALLRRLVTDKTVRRASQQMDQARERMRNLMKKMSV